MPESANTINGTSTINVRKNAANAGLSLTIGHNATGTFENTTPTDTVTVAAGDKLNYQTVPGAATGTINLTILSVLFEPNYNRYSNPSKHMRSRVKLYYALSIAL